MNDSRSEPARQRGNETDPRDADAILLRWQQSGFHGYALAEKRLDRRLVVKSLFAKLLAERLPIGGVIVAADEMSTRQWTQFLTGGPGLPDGWTVQTSEALLADDGRVETDSIVIADELETYLNEAFASAITGACAILGLCASPNGLGDATPFRKYVGRRLDLSQANGELDLSALVERRGVAREPEASASDLREQLLTVSDPQDYLAFYLSQAQKIPLLTADEEIVLSKHIEAGVLAEALLGGLPDVPWWGARPADDELVALIEQGGVAMERFLTGNLRLVYSVARRFSPHIELLDAVQEGNIGLIRAVEKFDHAQGYKFSTYATWWIRQAITRAIMGQTYLIRIPVHMHESDAAVINEWRRRKREGECASAVELASALGIATTDVESVLGRHRQPYSLDAMEEAGLEIAESNPDLAEDHLLEALLRKQVREVLETISEREAGIVSGRFGLTGGDEKTLEQMGAIYGVTRERIRQIQSQTIEKLRFSAELRDIFSTLE